MFQQSDILTIFCLFDMLYIYVYIYILCIHIYQHFRIGATESLTDVSLFHLEDPGVIIQNDLTWEKACLVNVPRSVSSCLRPCIESHDPKTRAVYGGSFQNGLQEFGGSGNIIIMHELAPSSNMPRAKPVGCWKSRR